ncbi:hypothetical protein M9H77_03109 [Catharanthus roseus]|uniref:Uncharacterized protein n=1 Tax=Catharanthus roseus TaxID=4058 RepID=A0ACC0CAT7_CATRO|nr:hypothetical protein M9H77_03109 [Catharanthus roseus]
MVSRSGVWVSPRGNDAAFDLFLKVSSGSGVWGPPLCDVGHHDGMIGVGTMGPLCREHPVTGLPTNQKSKGSCPPIGSVDAWEEVELEAFEADLLCQSLPKWIYVNLGLGEGRMN